MEERDEPNDTALMKAVAAQELAQVKTLIAAGEDVNARSNDGFTPLLFVAFTGNTEIIQVLLAHGANINTPDANGWTPLMTAAQQGWVETVRFLLRKGADVHSKGTDGETALSLASADATDTPEYKAIVTLLRQSGAKK